MADLLIDIHLSDDDGPFAADALPVLRDAANAYGVKRQDTGAVVVAAGVAMSAGTAGVGHYVYTLASAVPGVTYLYAIQAIVDGGVIPFAGQRTLAPASTLPTYLTVDHAVALAAGLMGFAAFTAATTDNKLKALATASARVSRSRRWQGRKLEPTQPLEFPRLDGCDYIAADAQGLPIVPQGVELATLYEADSLLAGQRARLLKAQHDGLSAQSIGTASETYRPQVDGRGVPILCHEADMLVAHYALRSGSLR